MKILVAEDESEIRELVTLFLESHFNATVIQADSGNEAIAILKSQKDIDCVVSDYSMPNGTGGDIFSYLRNSGAKIPFILCTAYDQKQMMTVLPVSEVAGYVVKPEILQPLRSAIENLNLDEGPAIAEGGVEYSPVRIHALSKIGKIPFELYIMLSPGKFVRLTHAGAGFDLEEVRKYESKKVVFLYMKRSDMTALMGSLNSRIEEICEAALYSEKEIQEHLASAIELVAAIEPAVNFPHEAKNLMKAAVRASMKTIRSNRKLDELFQEMVSNQNVRYLPGHSIAVSHLACGIASLMGWTSETTFHKLTLAAFFHDITLRNDDLARVQTLSELTLQESSFTPEEREAYLRHPEEGASVLSQIKELPAEVHQIVAQHHERPDGSGFPKQLDHLRIDPLSAVFSVAHELYNYFNQNGMDRGMKGFTENLGASYKKGVFGQILAAMIKSGTL